MSISTLFAVHISDGLLADWFTAAATAVAALLVAIAAFGLDETEIPRLALFTSALYVASQLHVKAGPSSVHLLLSAIAGIVLGRRVPAAIAIAVILQALLFAHGGVSTWGINTLTMSVPALAAGFLFHRGYARWPRRAWLLGLFAGLLASTLTVTLAGLSVYFVGIQSEFIVSVFAAIQLPVVGLEAVITAAMVQYLSLVKPEWLKAPAVH